MSTVANRSQIFSSINKEKNEKKKKDVSKLSEIKAKLEHDIKNSTNLQIYQTLTNSTLLIQSGKSHSTNKDIESSSTKLS